MDENRLFLSRIDDLVYKSYCGEYEAMGFLNELEVSVAHNYLNNLNVQHWFYGGYPSASRMYLFFDEISSDVQCIDTLLITLKGEHHLSHRDFLGSLMGLGITRECVGDILVLDSGAVVFVRREISRYIKDNLVSVGRFSAEVDYYSGDTNLLANEVCELEVLVTSLRVDNFVTSVCKCSRQGAAEMISADKVFLNYSCVNKPSKVLSQGDTLSIRGFGKFKIGTVLRKTKSDRLVLSVLQYK